MSGLPGSTPSGSEAAGSRGRDPLPSRRRKGEAAGDGPPSGSGGPSGDTASTGTSGVPTGEWVGLHLDDEERSRLAAALRRARAGLTEDHSPRTPAASVDPSAPDGPAGLMGADRGDRSAATRTDAPPQGSQPPRGRPWGRGGGKAADSGAPAGPLTEAGRGPHPRRVRVLLVSGGAAAVVLAAAVVFPLLTSGDGDGDGGTAAAVATRTGAGPLPRASSFAPAGPGTRPARVRGASILSNRPSPVAGPAKPATGEPSAGTTPTPSVRPTATKTEQVRLASPAAENPLSVHSTHVIAAGDRVVNDSVALAMTSGGELQVVVGGTVRWSSGATGAETVFQADGNLVMYDDANYDNPVWSSGTAGHPDAVLVLETNCDVVIEDNAVTLWSTGTAS